MQEIQSRAQAIKLAIFDVDGVLTDGRLYFGSEGLELKAFHSRDGHGLKMLQDSGVTVAIITARSSEAVERRMQGLGIQHVYQGQADKRLAYNELLTALHLTAEQVAYVGDDVIDLPVMSQVGLAIAVHDANDFVKQNAHWVTPTCGGLGAAREVCEFIMAAQGTLSDIQHAYLQP